MVWSCRVLVSLLWDKLSGKGSLALSRQLKEVEESQDVEKDEYWKEVASCLRVEQAKAVVREFHEYFLSQQIEGRSIRAIFEEKQLEEEKKKKEEEKDQNTEMTDEVVQGENDYRDEVALQPCGDPLKTHKPKYNVREKTGFEWNSYNKKHYDEHNPPPLMTQGYRFRIYLPDCTDSEGPRYKTYVDPTSPKDHRIIHFVFPRPYKDIAFRIVNRPVKRGRYSNFKNVFEEGCLTLDFQFESFIRGR